MKKYIILSLLLFFPVLALVPFVAQAAPTLTFNPVPEDAFNYEEEGKYLIIVDLTEYAEDTKIDFSVSGPEAHDDATSEVIETYEFITNEQHEFGWDGVLGSLEGEPGVYEITISGEDLFGTESNVLTHTVSIVESVPDPEPVDDAVEEEPADEEQEPAPEPTPPIDGAADTEEDGDTDALDEDDDGDVVETAAEDEDDDDDSNGTPIIWWLIGILIVIALILMARRRRGDTTLGDVAVTKEMDKSSE